MVGGGVSGGRYDREKRMRGREEVKNALSGRAAERARDKRLRREARLSDEDYDELKKILAELNLRRESIEQAMGFALDKAEMSEDVVKTITKHFAKKDTPAPVLVARLFLVSDILHNSSAPVRKASTYRTHFQPRLPKIFERLAAAHRRITGRLAAATMKKKVLSVLEVWDDWSLFPVLFITGLEMTFLGSNSDLDTVRASLVDVDEASLDMDELQRKCRQSGVLDSGSAKDLLIRLHCVNEYTDAKASGAVKGGIRTSNTALLKSSVDSLLGTGIATSSPLSSSSTAVAAAVTATSNSALDSSIDGEDLDGDDLDGDDLDGEDIDGEDIDIDGEDIDGEDL